MKKEQYKHHFERLLNWEEELKYFLRKTKFTIVWKWLQRCPSCYSDNVHFVEGSSKFEKWFCRDCTAMHFSYKCKHCHGKNWVFGAFKKHIYREYHLGKYRGRKRFYRKSNEEYIKGQISFYKKGLQQWQDKLKHFRKHKQYKLRYGK